MVVMCDVNVNHLLYSQSESECWFKHMIEYTDEQWEHVLQYNRSYQVYGIEQSVLQ